MELEGQEFLEWLAQRDDEGDGWMIRPVVDVEEADVDVPEPGDDVAEPEEDGRDEEEDEGVETDAPGGWQENRKLINNTLSTPMDPRYCISSAFVSIYSVYGEEFRLCEICYVPYSRRIHGEHLHRNTHETGSILTDLRTSACKCCGIPTYQVTRVEVCNICKR